MVTTGTACCKKSASLIISLAPLHFRLALNSFATACVLAASTREIRPRDLLSLEPVDNFMTCQTLTFASTAEHETESKEGWMEAFHHNYQSAEIGEPAFACNVSHSNLVVPDWHSPQSQGEKHVSNTVNQIVHLLCIVCMLWFHMTSDNDHHPCSISPFALFFSRDHVTTWRELENNLHHACDKFYT